MTNYLILHFAIKKKRSSKRNVLVFSVEKNYFATSSTLAAAESTVAAAESTTAAAESTVAAAESTTAAAESTVSVASVVSDFLQATTANAAIAATNNDFS